MSILIRTTCSKCKTNVSLAVNQLSVNRLLAGREVVGNCSNCAALLAFKVETQQLKEKDADWG